MDDQLDGFFSDYGVVATVAEVISAPRGQMLLCLDGNVPNLLALPPWATESITRSEAYKRGELILQDKASCFPAVLLDPRPEATGDVIDACAAPGNKTTHVAAVLEARWRDGGAGKVKVIAFEKDQNRAATLEKMVKKAGCEAFTVVGKGKDFLRADPQAVEYRNVGALLLDPSCSGSGIVGRDDMPELCLPEPTQKEVGGAGGGSKKRKRADKDNNSEKPLPVMINDDGETTILSSENDLKQRIQALAAFQLAVIEHAMAFPNAKRISYSTCSVYAGENEHVVLQALASDIARERGWRVLRRQDQVTGMREWPVRGDVAACGGDGEVAEACIRTYRDDGKGVMGFFVAGFVRVVPRPEDDGGPYVRDGQGRIVRDENGIPTLKSTGRKAIDLDELSDTEGECEEYFVGPPDGDGDGPYVRDEEGRIVRDVMGMPTLKPGSRIQGKDRQDEGGDGDGDGDDEWDGFDD